MNRLNRKVEYALMALKVMSQKRAGELTSAKEVSDKTGCPFDATARVLQLLVQKGILRSEQGAHGGYVLIRDLNRVSVLELNEVVLGPHGLAKCLISESDCELHARCNIISPIQILNKKLMEFYQHLTLGEIFRLRDKAADNKLPEKAADKEAVQSAARDGDGEKEVAG